MYVIKTGNGIQTENIFMAKDPPDPLFLKIISIYNKTYLYIYMGGGGGGGGGGTFYNAFILHTRYYNSYLGGELKWHLLQDVK